MLRKRTMESLNKVKPAIRYQLLSKNAKTPRKGTPMSAGFDIFSAEEYTINPHTTAKINTDLVVLCPPGTYARIADRSCNAYTNNIHIIGGVVDADFRGAIQVLVHNLGSEPFTFLHGFKIAQIIFEKIHDAIELEEVKIPCSPTLRGSVGFGSTN